MSAAEPGRAAALRAPLDVVALVVILGCVLVVAAVLVANTGQLGFDEAIYAVKARSYVGGSQVDFWAPFRPPGLAVLGTLAAPGCTTDAAGACTVDLDSDVTGSSTVTASWNGDVVTAEGNVTTSQSDQAEKVWVDALILIDPPHATNEVGDDHVFTVSVQQRTGGVASPAAGIDVHTSILSGPGSFVGPDDCTTDANGECTVTISSDATGSASRR